MIEGLKKYSVIYCDPPWNYRDKCHAGKRGAEYKYPTMSLEELAELNVSDISKANSAIFLWATAPHLGTALGLMDVWGFTYKTVAFTWVKTTKSGLPAWGMGNYTRSNAEFCLLGTRGRIKRLSAAVHSVILSPRREHSQKPAETRDRIINLFGDRTRIELFARERVPGWDVWGNEVDKWD